MPAYVNNPWDPKAMPNMIDQTPGQSNYDYYRGKKFDPGYAAYASNVGGLGQGLLGRSKPKDPFEGGLNADTIGNFRNMFGYDSYPDINNPNTISTTRKWMDNLSGGQNALLDQYSRKMANAGVASGRGGLGVQGGRDPYAAMRQQQMSTLAGQYSQNFNQAIEYQRQKALYDQSNANALASLYGTIYNANAGMYNTDMGIGRDLMGLQLQGLGQNTDAMLKWQQMGENAWNRDVDWNRGRDMREVDLQRAKTQMRADEQKAYQDKSDWTSKAARENMLEAQMNQILSRSPGADSSPRDEWIAERYRTWKSPRIENPLANPWERKLSISQNNENRYSRSDNYSYGGGR